MEIVFLTAQKPQPSVSPRNEIFEHVSQFAGNITFCHAPLAACHLLAYRLGGRWVPGWAGLARIMVHWLVRTTRCCVVILTRSLVLKTRVHVCGNFAPRVSEL